MIMMEMTGTYLITLDFIKYYNIKNKNIILIYETK